MMDLQTLLLWVARLACPLVLGLMVWWFLCQSGDAPRKRPSPSQRLSVLKQRQAALEAEIAALEITANGPTPADSDQHIDVETSSV